MATFPINPPPSTGWPTASDLETLLKRTFSAAETAAAKLLLAGVIASIRRHLKQFLSYVANESIDLRRERFRSNLWLPERPVTGITSITVDGELLPSDAYDFDPETGEVTFSSIVATWGTATCFDPLVTVVYSHGSDPLPDNVRDVCLGAAARAFYNPEGTIVDQGQGGGFTAGRSAVGALTKGEKSQLGCAGPVVA